MSWSQSFIPSATIRDLFKAVDALNIGGTGPDSLYVALMDDSMTATIDTDPNAYGGTGWTGAEVTGTNWSSGGEALANVATTIVATTGIMVDADDVSVANTTITSDVYGCLIYDSTVSDVGLVAVYFGGTTYQTNNGTFGIQWDTNGIFRLTLH